MAPDATIQGRADPLSKTRRVRAKVEVFLKAGVLDVQGKAIEGALHGLGFADVSGVRVGKTIEFDVKTADPPPPRRRSRPCATGSWPIR